MIGRYQTTRAFRVALEERLKQLAREQHLDLMRLRRQVTFDRLLAPLFTMPEPPWLLKGGYSFELRLGGNARTTKDLDLSIPAPSRLLMGQEQPADLNIAIRERLHDAAEQDLRDPRQARAPIRALVCIVCQPRCGMRIRANEIGRGLRGHFCLLGNMGHWTRRIDIS